MATDTNSESPGLGELKAEWREHHLCLRCDHHCVCKMASALDPNLLVVIAQCLAFEPAEGEGDDAGAEAAGHPPRVRYGGGGLR